MSVSDVVISTRGGRVEQMTAEDAPPANLLDPAWWVDLERVHDFEHDL